MYETLRRRSLLLSLPLLPLLLLLSMGLGGCSGTRLYERANSAAAAGDYPHAVAYDTLAARERSAQPPTFDQQYSDHVARYVAQVFAHLGPADLANADAQVAEMRGLLAWARANHHEEQVRAPVAARLGELTRVRFARVRSLAQSGSVDEAVVIGRGLVVDTPAETPERRELAELEKKARATHEAEVARLAAQPDHDAAVALHERFARQMGGSATEAGTRAESTLARTTGMAPTFDAAGAGDCEPAVNLLKTLLPSGGDTPVRFSFRFARCVSQPKTSSAEAWRTVPVEEEVTETISDLVPTQDCRSVSTGSATICDSYDFNGRRTCHQEQTTGQRCDTRYTAVEHTERVRRTRNVQKKYVVHSLTLDIDYKVTLSTDIDGKHHELDASGTATSGLLTRDDSAPSLSEAKDKAVSDVGRGLDRATRALAAFARKTQTDRLRDEAQAALAAGDAARAESLFVEVAVVQGGPITELHPAGVSAEQLRAALGNTPYEKADVAGKDGLVLPSISEAEVLEDAHERTDQTTLSAETRAGYSGALIGGVSRYETPAAGESSTGGFVAALVTGAQEVGTPFTGGGASMHLFGNFDGRTSSVDFSIDLGFGLKLGQLYLMPVGGVAMGTSTHASPSDSEFRPDAALRATALDGVYGGQLTFALPYPINLTVNAQLVRTAPIPLDDFKQFTTRLYGTVGYHFSSAVELSLFGRYWELDTDSVKPLEFFGGNGHDHRLVTVGVGIGGTSGKFLDTLFGRK